MLLAQLGELETSKDVVEGLEIEEFFPAVAEALQATPLGEAAATAAGRGGRWGEFDFSSLPEDGRHRSEEALLAWWRLGAGAFKVASQPRLEPILTLLGVAAPETSPVGHLRSDQTWLWLDLKHPTRFGRALVPAFGSDSSERMRLLLVAGNPSEAKLMEVVSQDDSNAAVLVLYFGTLTPDQRRGLSELTRPKRRGRLVAVVDDAVMVKLATIGNDSFEQTMSLVLPFVSLNPYTPFNSGEVPEEMFFGRKVESREVREPRGTSFVYGGRQLGKSALLMDAQRRFDDHSGVRKAIYVDLRAAGVGSAKGSSAVWQLLAARLSDSGVLSDAVRGSLEPRTITDAIAAWIRADSARSLLVLLDESDAFLKADSEARVGGHGDDRFPAVSLLKELMQETQRRFKVVFAGLHQVQRFQQIPNHPLLQLGMGSSIAIGPLAPADARALVERPLRALGYRFEDPGAVDYILTQCAYQPSVLQLVCSALVDNLLSKVRGRVGPPYRITLADVELAFDDRGLADEIRRRFLGTINLDDHYKVIAYAAAHGELGGGFGLSEAALREDATAWWPAGFGVMSPDEFRSLLTEMVGLGVLVEIDGIYRLRSQLVRRYLGTQSEIEDVLLAAESFEPTMQFEAATYRRCLASSPDRRSPLTDAQLADLCAKSAQVRVILSSPALGGSSVREALTQSLPSGETKLSWIKAANLPQHLQKDGGDSHRVLAVDFEDLRPELALERLRMLRAPGSAAASTSIVGIVGIKHLAVWRAALECPDAFPPIILLRRWDRVGLKVWAANVDLPFQAESTREDLLRATGGWPLLVERVAAMLEESRSLPSQVLESVQAELASESGARSLVAAAGIDSDPQLRGGVEQSRQLG